MPQALRAQKHGTLCTKFQVKKRKDLKKIMIIGAGPIVIGQVSSRGTDAPPFDIACQRPWVDHQRCGSRLLGALVTCPGCFSTLLVAAASALPQQRPCASASACQSGW
jgi:hypothetical protein